LQVIWWGIGLFSFARECGPNQHPQQTGHAADGGARRNGFSRASPLVSGSFLRPEVSKMADPNRESGRPACKIVDRFYGVGSVVRIRRGTFEGFQGEIAKLLYERQCAKVTISLGGRPVTIQVAFADLDPLD
jgi:hypothetical protein